VRLRPVAPDCADWAPYQKANFALGWVGGEDARAGEGMDVVPVLRTIRSVAPHNVEDGQRIEIARMQQLLAERD
jgi:hypothetical protein